MLSSTKTAITAILNADPTLDKNTIKAAILAFESGGNTSIPIPRLLRRPEVAKLLSVSVKRIDQLALQGTLRRITLPGTSRASGYREEDIRAIVEGREAGV